MESEINVLKDHTPTIVNFSPWCRHAKQEEIPKVSIEVECRVIVDVHVYVSYRLRNQRSAKGVQESRYLAYPREIQVTVNELRI
jgi:hypothetical protein